VKIVALDGHTLNPGDLSWEGVAALGDLEVFDRTAPGLVHSRAAGADVLLTNKTVLDAAAIAELAGLRFIAVLATGYNVVDVEAARRRGIPVANVPEYGSDSVAQHAFALLLELTNHVGDHAAAVRAGDWVRSPDFCFWQVPPLELAGRTLGIVGFGRIGRRLAGIARAFGMGVVATRPRRGVGLDEGDGIVWADVGTIFATADVVSLHCPLTPDNERFVNAALLARMKPTAYLLNTARGGLVDEAALADGLRAGQIAGAGLDVVSVEPMRPDNPLLTAPNCVITPHVAWASVAARHRLMETTVANVSAFLAGAPINVVNAA
jgi:glycerate dehydrogenase